MVKMLIPFQGDNPIGWFLMNIYLQFISNSFDFLRLMQIQQGRRSREPEYVLVSEKGSSRRRVFVIKVKFLIFFLLLLKIETQKNYFIQVQVDGFVAQGSGPNKKLAKRAAAEAALQLMGYSPKLPGNLI